MASQVEPEQIRQAVRENYAAVARRVQEQTNSCCANTCDCGDQSKLYSPQELDELPEGAALASQGCGNPLLLAQLEPGEIVLDLGSGGGIDVLLSARRVGPTGKAYGLDMTDEMLALARANARAAGATNVEFLKGQIEAIPLPDASVDVIISNCVINLSTDKDAVLREAYRVLRPGGRLAVADIVVQGQPLSLTAREALALWAGCLAGALEEGEYRRKLAAAGFGDIAVEVTRVATLDDLPEEARSAVAASLGPDSGSRVISAFVKATKPRAAREDGREYFNAVAPQWDHMRQSFFSEAVREQALDMAQVEAGQVAVDAGAGTGFITETLLKRGLRVIAVDQSEAMLAEMHKFAAYEGLECRLGESEALPIADAVADYAFGNMYLHHVESPLAAIKELARVLKPGGKLVLTDLDEHSFEFLRTEQHDRWMGFNREQVRTWFEEAGLQNVRLECTGEECCAASSCDCEQANVSIFAAYGEKALS